MNSATRWVESDQNLTNTLGIYCNKIISMVMVESDKNQNNLFFLDIIWYRHFVRIPKVWGCMKNHAFLCVFCIHQKRLEVSEHLFQEIQSLFYEPRRNLSWCWGIADIKEMDFSRPARDARLRRVAQIVWQARQFWPIDMANRMHSRRSCQCQSAKFALSTLWSSLKRDPYPWETTALT